MGLGIVDVKPVLPRLDRKLRSRYEGEFALISSRLADGLGE